MTPEQIEPGKSYACHFRVHTFVDQDHKLVDTRSLRPGETVQGATPGYYTGFGFIQKRDVAKRLFEILDSAHDRTWVVEWDNTWDIDSVEYSSPEEDHHASE